MAARRWICGARPAGRDTAPLLACPEPTTFHRLATPTFPPIPKQVIPNRKRSLQAEHLLEAPRASTPSGLPSPVSQHLDEGMGSASPEEIELYAHRAGVHPANNTRHDRLFSDSFDVDENRNTGSKRGRFGRLDMHAAKAQVVAQSSVARTVWCGKLHRTGHFLAKMRTLFVFGGMSHGP